MPILIAMCHRGGLTTSVGFVAGLYRNRVVLVVRTRWGRIVEHEDFYEDTGRIVTFEGRLRELGIEPAG